MHSIFTQRVFSLCASLSIFMNSVSYGHIKPIDIDIPTAVVESTVVENVVVEEPEEVVIETPVEEIEPVEPEPESVPLPEYFVEVVDGRVTEESLQSICKYVGNIYDISPELLQAIAWCESRYAVKAVSSCNAKGLCQIILKWHGPRMKRLGITEEDVYDPYKNMLLCADILDELRRHKYGGDIKYVLMAYNRGQYGERGANALYKKGIITEYVTTVLAKEQEFKSNS